MSQWRWIDTDAVNAIHDRQISEHGGLDGVRDPGAIESALCRARNLFEHAKPDAADLAAAYCVGIIKNHGYADGNKRTGWIVARLFLLDNDVRISFNAQDAVRAVERIAAGEIGDIDFAAWIRERIL